MKGKEGNHAQPLNYPPGPESTSAQQLKMQCPAQLILSYTSLHDRVVKKGVSFLRGNVSIITSSDLSDM